MKSEQVRALRKTTQQLAYTALQFHEEVARKTGFSGTDHKYLGFFLQKGPLTAGELAALTGLSTGAVTGLIDRFEKRKLVKRMLDENDRRKVIVVPDLKKISDLLEPFYKVFQDETDKLIAGFTDQEMATIQSYLQQYIELMNKNIRAHKP